METIVIEVPGDKIIPKTKLVLTKGHYYGLIGENGVGKSSLLRFIHSNDLSSSKNIRYMEQEFSIPTNITSLEYIITSTISKDKILTELQYLEDQESEIQDKFDKISLDNETGLNIFAEKLSSISDKIDALKEKLNAKTEDDNKPNFIDSYKAIYKSLPADSKDIIKGLGFTRPIGRLATYIDKLSGGWQMRAQLAKTIQNLNSVDILLLDEPTNHLDLESIIWLQNFISKIANCVVIIISHDRAFLNSICSDIISMKQMEIQYFPGNYDAWLNHVKELEAFNLHRTDSKVRKQDHISKSIQMAKSRGADDVAKSKIKKLERAAMLDRSDGKKFKLFSLEKMSEKYVRLPEKVAEIKADKLLRFKFPLVDYADLRIQSSSSVPLLSINNSDISIQSKDSHLPIIKNLTHQIHTNSKIAVVGPNGQGKSTFLNALLRIGDPQNSISSSEPYDLKVSGSTSCQTNLRIACLFQNCLENLIAFEKLSSVEYMKLKSPETIAELDIRSKLGKFGLTGEIALQEIRTLSGGQKSRLCLCQAMMLNPHILLLDEPTNHFSLSAIEALIIGLQDFTGALVLVSHNQYFLSSICNELVIIENSTFKSLHTVESTNGIGGIDMHTLLNNYTSSLSI